MEPPYLTVDLLKNKYSSKHQFYKYLRLSDESRTKGVAMDSTFLMFAVVMLVIFAGGIALYMKG